MGHVHPSSQTLPAHLQSFEFSGVLAEQVAIKRLDRRGMQGDKEFGMEASMLCSLKHANIVTLRGVCVEGDNRCTIFDLAANV